MKTSQNIEQAANLKGMAKHTYNRVMSAMAEDSTAAMLHAFAALTDGAKAIALQSGKFSNLYIRGERKGMAVEEAARELTALAAAGVTCKLRKIDHICAVAFLAEYISRQRKAIETPETPNPENNTPATMNANEINARRAANEFVNAPTHRVNTVDKYGNEMSCPCWGLDMAESIAANHRAKFPNDTTEIVEQENRDEIQAYWDKENANTQNA